MFVSYRFIMMIVVIEIKYTVFGFIMDVLISSG